MASSLFVSLASLRSLKDELVFTSLETTGMLPSKLIFVMDKCQLESYKHIAALCIT